MVNEKDEPVGQQLATFNKRAELLFEHRTGIQARALTYYEFSCTLQHQDPHQDPSKKELVEVN